MEKIWEETTSNSDMVTERENHFCTFKIRLTEPRQPSNQKSTPPVGVGTKESVNHTEEFIGISRALFSGRK